MQERIGGKCHVHRAKKVGAHSIFNRDIVHRDQRFFVQDSRRGDDEVNVSFFLVDFLECFFNVFSSSDVGAGERA